MSTTPTSYSDILAKLCAAGWRVETEGPSGAQMKRPRVMRASTKLVIALGVVAVPLMGAGLVLLGLGALDYYILTKEASHFLNRERPAEPRPEKSSGFTAIALGALAALLLFGALASSALNK